LHASTIKEKSDHTETPTRHQALGPVIPWFCLKRLLHRPCLSSLFRGF